MNWKERFSPITKVDVVKSVIPHVFITQEAADKMKIIIDKSTQEVGWLCSVSELSNGYLVEDVFIIAQRVHATTTELTEEGLQAFGEELMSAKGGMDLWCKIRGWGHSHVNMGVSPSAQDDNQMEQLTANNTEFFVRIIGNKKGEMEIGVFDYRSGVSYLNVPWSIEPDEYITAIEDEIEELYDKISNYKDGKIAELEPVIDLELKQKVSSISYNVYGNKNGQQVFNYNQKKNERTNSETSGRKNVSTSLAMDYSWVNTYISEDDMIEIGGASTELEQKCLLDKHFPNWGEHLHESIASICVEAYEEWQWLRLMETSAINSRWDGLD